MYREIIDAIEDGWNGLSRIIGDSYLRDLIGRYHVDDSSESRIRAFGFHDCGPYFFSKRRYCVSPSEELKGPVLDSRDEDMVKWFLLLYSISAASDLFRGKILRFLDKDVSANLSAGRDDSDSIFDVYSAPEELQSMLVGGIVDVDAIAGRAFPQVADLRWQEERDDFRQGVSQFMLTAGYHYLHDSSAVPREISERGVDITFMLSCALYISIITGEDFYDSLQVALQDNGAGRRLDDILAMARKNSGIEKIRSENRALMAQVAANEERIRQLETAGDIISASFGPGFRRESVEERIAKCNDQEHRRLLYELESATGTRLSFLDLFGRISQPRSIVEGFLSERGLFFSESEFQTIGTIEDFIDKIFVHRRFIGSFKDAFVSDTPLEPIGDDDPYDLDSRIREVESALGVEVRRDGIRTLEDLVLYAKGNAVVKGVFDVVVRALSAEPSEVTLASRLTEDLGADSLDTVELLMEAENSYGIEISADDAVTISTVGDICMTVSRLLEQSGQASG